jgi:hypothetical protein
MDSADKRRALRLLEAHARAAAKSRGMLAIKSDRTIDNYGQFMLVDLKSREIIAGHYYELSPMDILTICQS